MNEAICSTVGPLIKDTLNKAHFCTNLYVSESETNWQQLKLLSLSEQWRRGSRGYLRVCRPPLRSKLGSVLPETEYSALTDAIAAREGVEEGESAVNQLSLLNICSGDSNKAHSE